MIRVLVATGVLLVAALVQSLVGPALPLLGSRPDLPLVVVVAWSMLRGSNEGAIVGFLGGLMLDSAVARPFGLNAALLGLLGFCTGLGETNLYRGNVPFFLGAGAAATLVYHGLTMLALQAAGIGLPPLARTLQLVLPAAVMNALLLAPAFLLCRRLLRMLGGWQQIRV